MNRRLLLLNVILVALTALCGWQLRREWTAARAREAAMLGKTVKPVPAPPPGTAQPPAPLTPATYIEIAEKMLFSRDRNPVVVVETAPPPPPKPMPPLPVFHGAMNLGDGPIAIMSEKANTPHREFRAGGQIGEFKLVAISPREVLLDWEGKQVAQGIEQLKEAAPEAQQAAQTQRTEAPAAAQPKVQAGPGTDIGKGVRACVPNDSTPPGTVVDGLRKVVTDSPFGAVCRWEPVR